MYVFTFTGNMMGEDLRFSPWDVQSLYELQVYDCPECVYQDWSKQSFVSHAIKSHPDSVQYLQKIQDDSMDNVEVPWLDQEDANENHSDNQYKITYNGTFPAKCNMCNKTFSNNRILICHILEQHSFGQIKCASCSEEFSDMLSLEIHFKNKHSQESQNDEVILIKVEEGNLMVKTETDFDQLDPLEDGNEEVQDSNVSSQNGNNMIDDVPGLNKCQRCDQYFSTEKNLQNHLKIVHKEKLVQKPTSSEETKMKKCRFCNYLFSTEAFLQNHMETTHRKKLIRQMTQAVGSKIEKSQVAPRDIHEEIEETSKITNFNIPENVLQKNKDTIKEGTTICQNCGKDCQAPSKLIVHLSTEHKTTCTYCLENFDKTIQLIGHMDEAHGDILYACISCEIIFENAKQKRAHMENCEEKYKCLVCHQSFKSMVILRSHIRGVHRKTRNKFACDRCQKSYATTTELKKHIEIVHDEVSIDIPCEFCGKIFRHQSHLTDHIKRMHKRTKPKNVKIRKCDHCDKKFQTKAGLQFHRRQKHLGENNFQCHKCGKGFLQQWRLENHFRLSHEGAKPHKCLYCEKAFARKQQLDAHFEHHHSTSKSYICQYCKLAVSSKLVLKTHIKRVHEKVPTHKCEQCQKTFVYPYNYRLHVKVVHEGKKDFKCDFCATEFVRNTQLQKHILEQHPNVLVQK